MPEVSGGHRGRKGRERKFQGMNWPGSEKARERRGHGANLPCFYWPIRCLERIGPGAKRIGTVTSSSSKRTCLSRIGTNPLPVMQFTCENTLYNDGDDEVISEFRQTNRSRQNLELLHNNYWNHHNLHNTTRISANEDVYIADEPFICVGRL